MISAEADWVAVDWGTSNLRAWGIGPCGDVIFSRTSDQGMSKLTPDAYPPVLGALLTGNFPSKRRQIDVLICGMAGARQGWMEAPYLDAPADLDTLVDRAHGAAIATSSMHWRRTCFRPASITAVEASESTQPTEGRMTWWPNRDAIGAVAISPGAITRSAAYHPGRAGPGCRRPLPWSLCRRPR
jgi:hypothetical protein